MLYRKLMAVSSDSHKTQKYAVWAESRIVECQTTNKYSNLWNTKG